MSTQPNALRFAERLELHYMGLGRIDAALAASELRRLHAENERLKTQAGEPFAWAKLDELTEHFNSVGCGTAYRLPGEGRAPLYTSPQPAAPVVRFLPSDDTEGGAL